MGEKKIHARLRRLIILFLIMCIAIYGVLRYISHEVGELYLTSIHDRLEEQAIQYENSFYFKLDADMLTLRAMAGMLQDHPEQDAQTLLMGLQEASNASQFVCLGYFQEDGSGFAFLRRQRALYRFLCLSFRRNCRMWWRWLGPAPVLIRRYFMIPICAAKCCKRNAGLCGRGDLRGACLDGGRRMYMRKFYLPLRRSVHRALLRSFTKMAT